MLKTLCAATALLAAGIVTASAHMTLEHTEAAVGSTYKAVFRVPHGCGDKPTNVVRVRIPDGVIAVQPMPKAGWTLEKIRGAYDTTYEYHGAQVGEGVREVVWSGGNLLDDEYDEFVLRGYLTPGLPVGTTLYFPAVQECPDGATARWIEIPAEGQDVDELDGPAPGVKLLEKDGGH